MATTMPAELPELWVRGLANPQHIHMQETRDGVPATLNLDGHTVGVAICRTLLTGTPLDKADEPPFIKCPTCLKLRVGVPYRRIGAAQ